MRKALVNYWVDMVTGVAFLFCAVTGLVRLFPAETVSISSGGQAVIFGISTAAWQTVHDWSGAIMAAGVGVHTVLHLRWLAHMTRRIASGDKDRRATARTMPVAGVGKGGVPATVAASAVEPLPGMPRVVAAAELERLERRWEARRRSHERRHTRKAFLTGAAAVGGAALLVVLGLGGRDAASGLLDRPAEVTSSADGASADQAQTTDSGSASSPQDPSVAGASTDGGATGTSSSGTTAARVTVDADSCVGCGACLQVCPAGVFAASGNVVTAQDPQACRLCGRCTQVCPATAITLNA